MSKKYQRKQFNKEKFYFIKAFISKISELEVFKFSKKYQQ